MSKRAVLYARVSGDDRSKDGRNLEGQIEMCREHANAHGYEVVEELAEDDRGASGASFELPQLNRIREMAAAGGFDVLVVRELDRLSRNLAKQLIVEDELKRAGVAIEYVLAKYDDSPEGNLMKHVRATIAEYEREKIKERMGRGRMLKVKRGEVLLHGDRPPYGFRVSEDGKTLVVYEPEARIVRQVFTWFAMGDGEGIKLGTRAIARRLTCMGVPTWRDSRKGMRKKRGYAVWSLGTVTAMLRNETYVGRWYYGKQNKGRQPTFNPRSEWVEVKVPSIVSDELFEAAKAQRAYNQEMSRRSTKYEYLVARRVYCGQCGHKASGSSRCERIANGQRREYGYYICGATFGGIVGASCHMPRFNARLVDGAVWAWVKGFMTDPAALADGLRAIEADRERETLPLKERLRVVDDLFADNRAQLGRLLDLYLAGEFPKAMMAERKARLEVTIESLSRERQTLAGQLDASALTEEQVQGVQQFAARVGQGLESADFETRRRVIEALDVTVTLAVENGQRVAYARCLLGSQPLSVANMTTLRPDPALPHHRAHRPRRLRTAI